MSNEWLDSEIDACVRSYLWMRRAIDEGHKPTKKRIREALIKGPLSERSHGSIEYRFQNISAVLANRGEAWIEGYLPAKHVGAATEERIAQFIDAYSKHRHARRLNWLVTALPAEVVKEAAKALALDQKFEYSDSTDYDLDLDGTKLPPKKVIGYSGLLHYGAPLFSENFSGGEDTPCFKKLASSGLKIDDKPESSSADTETPGFRKAVAHHKKNASNTPPKGNSKPKKVNQSSESYERDASVVAFVENRANGICELCCEPAPFNRLDGSPFLEVHHIVPLSEEGPDTVDNAAALCPNCHRACHYGSEAAKHRESLLNKISNKSVLPTADAVADL
ncbi:HNH endonuclease [Verrucomicrobiales bacterium]|nr:HNH endonuclease [Verrucomicrobiales bacterium]